MGGLWEERLQAFSKMVALEDSNVCPLWWRLQTLIVMLLNGLNRYQAARLGLRIIGITQIEDVDVVYVAVLINYTNLYDVLDSEKTFLLKNHSIDIDLRRELLQDQ